MNNNIERRAYTFDINREEREDGTSTLVGRPIVYGSATDIGGFYSEIIEPGALDGADMRDVPLLVNHNDKMIPVARSRRNTPNSTLQLVPDAEGLSMTANIDTERNATARELDSAVERRDIDGMSFGFIVDGERWDNLDTDYPTRHILKFAQIVEVSAVTWPAYAATTIDARDAKAALDSARAALDSARENAPEARSLDSDKGTQDTTKTLELLKAKLDLIQ